MGSNIQLVMKFVGTLKQKKNPPKVMAMSPGHLGNTPQTVMSRLKEAAKTWPTGPSPF